MYARISIHEYLTDSGYYCKGDTYYTLDENELLHSNGRNPAVIQMLIKGCSIALQYGHYEHGVIHNIYEPAWYTKDTDHRGIPVGDMRSIEYYIDGNPLSKEDWENSINVKLVKLGL